MTDDLFRGIVSTAARHVPAPGDERALKRKMGESKKSVFVIYDFAIGQGIRDVLGGANDLLDDEWDVEWFENPENPSGGNIWSETVAPGLTRCDRVLAYIDKLNVNVGFEIGFALGGREKEIALCHYAGGAPEWSNQQPFAGQYRGQISTEEEIRDLLGKEWALRSQKLPPAGKELLLLCPLRGGPGSTFQKLVQTHLKDAGHPPPKLLDLDRTHLDQFASCLEGVERVLWILAPHTEGDDHRDGRENASFAILAGLAAAAGREVLIWQHEAFRLIADIAGRAVPFQDRDGLKGLLEQEFQIASKATSPVDPPLPPLPPFALGELPHGTDRYEIEGRFVGRTGQLDDIRSVLQGRSPARTFWFWGLGGMGKSWLLRRAMMDAEDAGFACGLIDFDLEAYRDNLPHPPSTGLELCDLIARRLGQLYGEDLIAPYRHARVEHASLQTQRSSWRARYDQDLKEPSAAMRDAMAAHGVSKGELAEFLARKGSEFLFREWLQRKQPAGRLEDLLDPDNVLVSGLTKCFPPATRKRLCLVFDTLEVLEEHVLDRIRVLLGAWASQQHGREYCVLLGSRAQARQDEYGTRGWRATIGDGWRQVEFGRDLSLTDGEIGTLLEKADPALVDRPDLAAALQRVTRGHLYSIAVLLRLHQNGDPVLQDLSDLENEDVGDSEAIHEMERDVTHRYLKHLGQAPQRHREELESVIALALLPRIDRKILGALWGADWRKRLRDLGSHSGLISVGDLHDQARSVLRRLWRREPYERPDMFDAVARRLQAVLQGLPELTSGDRATRLALRLIELDVSTWTRPNTSTAYEFLGVLAEATLEGVSVTEALTRVDEFPPERGIPGIRARAIDQTWRDLQFRSNPVGWLRQWVAIDVEDKHAESWSDPEFTSWKMLCAVAADPMDVQELARCATQIEMRSSPEGAVLARAIWSEFVRCWDENVAGAAVDWHASIELAARLGLAEGQVNLGLALLMDVHCRKFVSANQPEAAVRRLARDHYVAAIETTPTDASPENSLGSLLHNHVDVFVGIEAENPNAVLKSARSRYLAAIEKDSTYSPPENGLGNLLSEHAGVFVGIEGMDRNAVLKSARARYLAAIEKDPTSSYPEYGLGILLKRHADVFVGIEGKDRSYVLRSARTRCLAAIEKDPSYSSPENGLGNLLSDNADVFIGLVGEERSSVLRSARARYRAAIEKDPLSSYPENGLGNLLSDHAEVFFGIEGEDRNAVLKSARTRYLAAIEKDSSSSYPLNGLGNLLRYHADVFVGIEGENRNAVLESARARYLAAIAKEPTYSNPECGLGNLLSDDPDVFVGIEGKDRSFVLKAARKRYLIAIEKDPAHSHPENGLGSLLSEHQDVFIGTEGNSEPSVLKSARNRYLAAIEKDRTSSYPENGLGILLQNHADVFVGLEGDDRSSVLKSARNRYLAAIRKDPACSYPECGLGSLLWDNADVFVGIEGKDRNTVLKSARARYLAAIEKDPSYGAPHNGLAWNDYLHGVDLENALAHARRAVDLLSSRVFALHTLACIEWRLGLPEATATLKDYIRRIDASFVTANRKDVTMPLREALAHRTATELADWLTAIESAEHMQPWITALRQMAGPTPEQPPEDPEAAACWRELRRDSGQDTT